MRRRQNFYSAFVLFSLAACAIFFLSQAQFFASLQSFVGGVFTPLRSSLYSAFVAVVSAPNDQLRKLKQENARLAKMLVLQDALKKEVAALRDQYESTEIQSRDLLQASVIGAPGFLPGISPIDVLIVDRGERHGVKKGMAVVFDDLLVGKIIATTPNLAQVQVITSKESSLTVRTQATNALGIVRGQGDGMILDNVLLSEALDTGDLVVTNGEVDREGLGVPPGLLVGTIASVDKKASALFQQAHVVPSIESSRLRTVFIIIHPVSSG